MGFRKKLNEIQDILQTTQQLRDKLTDLQEEQVKEELLREVKTIEQMAVNLQDNFTEVEKLEECVQNLVITSHFEDSIQKVLKAILSYYQAERIFIYEIDWSTQTAKQIHSVAGNGVAFEKEDYLLIYLNRIDHWMKQFEIGKVVCVPKAESLKDVPNRQKEYEILHEQMVDNIIVVPYRNNNTLQGFLRIDNLKKHQNYINLLEYLAFFIGNEIYKNRLADKMQKLSYRDQLTNCLNRNAYNEALDLLVNWKVRYDSAGIAFADMNGLKYMNDTYGHTYGDRMIQHFAQVLYQYFDETQVFRISGDEFVIIDMNAKYDDFVQKAKSLWKRLNVTEKHLAAVGYVWENSEVEIPVMVQQAEAQMYLEKRKYYMSKSEKGRLEQPSYMEDMFADIKNEEFLVYLQPKYKVDTNEIYGAEALVRRRDKNGDIITPFQFIQALETANKISIIDFFVFEKVCETLVRWKKEGYESLSVSTNFSPITFMENGFVEHIIRICEHTGVDCSKLIIEITESSNQFHMEQLSENMQKLKKKGFTFALDDVGSRYSTLQMFTIPELDIAKLDRSLIMRLTNGTRDQMIVEKLIDLSNTLGMVYIAEGVESEKQLDILRDLGCERIQGYLVGRPMPIEEFEEKYVDRGKKETTF